MSQTPLSHTFPGHRRGSPLPVLRSLRSVVVRPPHRILSRPVTLSQVRRPDSFHLPLFDNTPNPFSSFRVIGVQLLETSVTRLLFTFPPLTWFRLSGHQGFSASPLVDHWVSLHRRSFTRLTFPCDFHQAAPTHYLPYPLPSRPVAVGSQWKECPRSSTSSALSSPVLWASSRPSRCVRKEYKFPAHVE